MMKINLIILLICFFNTLVFAGDYKINQSIAYPYKATETRANEIKSKYKQIALGMPVTKVIEKMGMPDETHELFEPKIKNPKQIGFTHWYLIQRLKNNGSVNERNEKLVRISFDLNWTVIAIDHWGFE